ncbi:MAG TPA: FKBP-type peptidyl-prolyl cis-trans isomerase [Acidimicrobiia bacterium]|nr:FKBP-type peptidyl-prolyl cis-trans isomerase [Acidimicrobiia bacterium]
MRRLAVLVLVIALAGLTALVAPASAANGSLDEVTVTGAEGEKPTLEFAKGLSVKKTASLEVTEGTGETIAKGNRIIFDFVAVNTRTKKELETSYGNAPASVQLDKTQVPKGLVKGLAGTAVGSRVLVAFAPKDGLSSGLKGTKKSDTLLFAIDVRAIYTPLERAEGEAVSPTAGLPTVALDADGKPTITIPGSDPSSTLVVQPLIKGAGAVVTAGQTITVHYTGVVYAGNKQFDSSWDRGAPIDFAIGAGQVIAGWDEGLVGQTVGSQLLLVIPPDKGYGEAGQPNAGISGTDTLVFVVDILGAF